MTGPDDDLSLTVIRDGRSFVVSRKRDPRDWVVVFDELGEFPALDWANNLVELYNNRLQATPADDLPPSVPADERQPAASAKDRTDD